MDRLDVVMAQVNPLVGDLDGNASMVIEQSRRALRKHAAQLVIFPELTLSGCPAEDLLLRPEMVRRIERALARLCRELPPEPWVVVGYPRCAGGGLRSVAGVFHGGEIVAEYAKLVLAEPRVSDEKRYFIAGEQPCVLTIGGFRIALAVGEDIHHGRPIELARHAGAELLLSIEASAFHIGRQLERRAFLERLAVDTGMSVICVNQAGAQDELVFDGGSMAMGRDGTLAACAPQFEAGLHPLCVVRDAASGVVFVPGQVTVEPGLHATVYAALVLGVRDYVEKNRFRGVVLGLSGGIDSALTLAIAVDALGAERVEAMMMPFHYTASMSIEDAQAQAQTLGVRFRVVPIAPMVDAFTTALDEESPGASVSTTVQNIQARCRGVLLMAVSNSQGSLVLTTGNKSELAVGYSTLYGDTAGGFDVLKDVSKTLVFELARYRNDLSPVIPQRVIERPPSAELAPGQTDEDSLPPYAVLDRILECCIEHEMGADAIIAQGFDSETVHRVLRLVDLNEYKRRQAPIGVGITRRGFGRERRYPITSGWRSDG